MTLYARIASGVVAELLETDADIADLFPPTLVWVPATPSVAQGWTYTAGAFSAPPPPPAPDIPSQVVPMVQLRLDSFARTAGFDNIFTACTYTNSSNPKRRARALYCETMRDTYWNMCEQIEAEVLAGIRPVPTEAEVLALLPPLVWPV